MSEYQGHVKPREEISLKERARRDEAKALAHKRIDFADADERCAWDRYVAGILASGRAANILNACEAADELVLLRRLREGDLFDE